LPGSCCWQIHIWQDVEGADPAADLARLLADLGVSSRLRTIGRIGKAPAAAHPEALLVAIENGDPEAARAAMRSHILAAGEDMNLSALKTIKAK
jgi:DNA-binding GntR family transcriptional regulator